MRPSSIVDRLLVTWVLLGLGLALVLSLAACSSGWDISLDTKGMVTRGDVAVGSTAMTRNQPTQGVIDEKSDSAPVVSH